MKKHIFVVIICLLSTGLIIGDWKSTSKDAITMVEKKEEKDSFDKLPPICKGCACVGGVIALVLHGIGVCIEKAEKTSNE